MRLHYLERGRARGGAPAIVLLHGNGGMVEDAGSSGLIARLAATHRVIAIDRPGFGRSARPRGRIWTAAAQARVIGAALRQLGVHRPVLVGHSWGTLVALNLALDQPAEVAGLVLLSGFYTPEARLDVLLAAAPALPLLGPLACHTVLPLLGRLLAPLAIRQIFAPAPVGPGFRSGFPLALALRPGQLRASAADTALMTPAAFGLRGRRLDGRLPVIILAGAADRVVAAGRHSLRLHRRIPQSRLWLIDGAGHMVHHTAPDQVVAAIRCAAAPRP